MKTSRQQAPKRGKSKFLKHYKSVFDVTGEFVHFLRNLFFFFLLFQFLLLDWSHMRMCVCAHVCCMFHSDFSYIRFLMVDLFNFILFFQQNIVLSLSFLSLHLICLLGWGPLLAEDLSFL